MRRVLTEQDRADARNLAMALKASGNALVAGNDEPEPTEEQLLERDRLFNAGKAERMARANESRAMAIQQRANERATR